MRQGRVLRLSPKSEQSLECILKLAPKVGESLKLNSMQSLFWHYEQLPRATSVGDTAQAAGVTKPSYYQ